MNILKIRNEYYKYDEYKINIKKIDIYNKWYNRQNMIGKIDNRTLLTKWIHSQKKMSSSYSRQAKNWYKITMKMQHNKMQDKLYY